MEELDLFDDDVRKMVYGELGIHFRSGDYDKAYITTSEKGDIFVVTNPGPVYQLSEDGKQGRLFSHNKRKFYEWSEISLAESLLEQLKEVVKQNKNQKKED